MVAHQLYAAFTLINMDDVKVILQHEKEEEKEKYEKQMKKKKGLWRSEIKGVERKFLLFVYKVYSVAKCPI